MATKRVIEKKGTTKPAKAKGLTDEELSKKYDKGIKVHFQKLLKSLVKPAK